VLTIHVGLHKTGSTAIQKGLSRLSPGELRGIRYLGRESSANNDGFRWGARHFCIPARAHQTQTVRLLRQGHHVVLSDEDFLGWPGREEGEIYESAAEDAARVREFFKDITPFKLVVYIRPQQDWAESVYNQLAKSAELDAAKFGERLIESPYIRWSRLVADIKEQIGPDRLVVRPYLPDTNVTADFLSLLGLTTPRRLTAASRQNPSLTPQQLVLRQKLSKVLEDADELSLLGWAMQMVTTPVSRPSPQIFSYFPEVIQEELIRIAANDWAQLREEVADTLWASPRLFESVALHVQQASAKRYLGPLSDVSADEETVQLIRRLLPYVRSHPSNLPSRARRFFRRFSHQIESVSSNWMR